VAAEGTQARRYFRTPGSWFLKGPLLLRHQAGLPACVSALRIFDVIAWMEGQDQGL